MNPSLSQQLRSLLPYVLFFLALPLVQATHNRAGEITYTQIGNLTIEATATIYSKASSTAADRDTIEICWGDGTCSSVVRINGPINGMGVPDGEILPNDIKRSLYRTTHTYGSINRYTMSVVDPNRNGGICNLNFPLSQNIQFYIRTTVTFFDPIFLGSFYKEFPCNFFFTWKSFVKFFPTFKLEIEFYSHKKVVSPKLENCAHLYIVNFF